MLRVLLCLTAALACLHTARAAEITLVQAGTALLVPGQPARHQVTIIATDGRITAVTDGFIATAPGATAKDHVRIIDLRQAYVLPGLIDCHVHLTGQESPNDQLEGVTTTDAATVANGVLYAGRTLYAGFTTVRDAGGELQAVLALRDGIKTGEIKGPRMISAGEPLSATGGHNDANGYRPDVFATPGPGICDGADACRHAVRYQVKYRVDWIKIMATGGVLDDSAAGTDHGAHAGPQGGRPRARPGRHPRRRAGRRGFHRARHVP
jgi:imidazolonepropionase-like amidohydrolase